MSTNANSVEKTRIGDLDREAIERILTFCSAKNVGRACVSCKLLNLYGSEMSQEYKKLFNNIFVKIRTKDATSNRMSLKDLNELYIGDSADQSVSVGNYISCFAASTIKAISSNAKLIDRVTIHKPNVTAAKDDVKNDVMSISFPSLTANNSVDAIVSVVSKDEVLFVDFITNVVVTWKKPEKVHYMNTLVTMKFFNQVGKIEVYLDLSESARPTFPSRSKEVIKGKLQLSGSSQGGAAGREHFVYKGRKYAVRRGSRGGRYITVGGARRYLASLN